MYSISTPRLVSYIFILLVLMPTMVLAQSSVNLSLDDGTMDEEFLGTGGFTVTRDGSTTGALNVFVEVTGSATVDADFSMANITGYSYPIYYVHLPAGQNSASVTLTPKKDNKIEGDENVVFTLVDGTLYGSDYTVGAQTTAEMTLTDDVAEVILSLDDGTMDEEFQGTGGFSVTRDNHGNPDQAINIFVAFSGSATVDTDFSMANITGYSYPIYYVHLPAGQNSASVTLTPKKDNVIEGDETVVFTLVDGTSYGSDYTVGAQTTAEMTIFDFVDRIFLDSFED